MGLSAPVGTGLLWVRRERIGDFWALTPSKPKQDYDVRKFEEVGTLPYAPTLAVGEALAFHEAIGAAAKQARLVALRDRLARPVAGLDRVRMLTSLAPARATGIATFAVDGIDSGQLQRELFERHGIWTAHVQGEGYEGVRVAVGVATTLGEVDRFAEVLGRYLAEG